MTPQEKLQKIQAIVEHYKSMLLLDVDCLESTAFYIHNRKTHDKLIEEVEKVLASKE